MDEQKCCETQVQCGSAKKGLAALFKVVLGLIFLVLGGWAIIEFWGELLIIIKGGVGLLFLLIGVIILAIAKE